MFKKKLLDTIKNSNKMSMNKNNSNNKRAINYDSD